MDWDPFPKAIETNLTTVELLADVDWLSDVAAGRGLHQLVTDLRAVSNRFGELWDTHDVTLGHLRHKAVRHPDVGLLELDCDTLTISEDDLRITVYTAPVASPAAAALELVGVIGTQAMSAEG